MRATISMVLRGNVTIFFPIGMHYYTGVVENAEERLRHKVATQCTFGVRSSTMKADPCITESYDKATCKEV